MRVCVPVSEGRTLSKRARAIRLGHARHCTGSAPKWKPAFPVLQSWLSGELKLAETGTTPLAKKDSACIFGHSNPVGLDTTRRSSSIDSTVAADQESIVTPVASSFKNGFEDLAGSAALACFQFQRICAARETSYLRCNELNAPMNMALGTTGIEIQGWLEATQNQRFAHASDLGTSLTLAAPAAGYRDPTPNSALGKRADSTLMQETGELRLLPKFSKAREKKNPNLPEADSLRSRAGEAPEDARAGPCLVWSFLALRALLGALPLASIRISAVEFRLDLLLDEGDVRRACVGTGRSKATPWSCALHLGRRTPCGRLPWHSALLVPIMGHDHSISWAGSCDPDSSTAQMR